ncbi:MAG TPA: ADP-ribosylglycohydrolase family protein, partial [Candidatus Paceibacterota bacterium]
MPLSRRDRSVAAMLGVLAGDALGAPYETWKPDAIQADMERRGGLVPFDYMDPWKKRTRSPFPMGRPTDDSDLTAALAISLVEKGGLDEE